MNSFGTSRPAPRRRQRGLTLIEFMVSITIGLLMVAAIAALIASQSGNRAEVDRAGRMIENGRYAIRAMADDLQLAGYWGELDGVPTTATTVGGVLPNPCSVLIGDIRLASQLHIQGYDWPAASPSCVAPNHMPGTDILVVRHADVNTVLTPSTLDPDVRYVQTGLNATGSAFDFKLDVGDSTEFTLKMKDKVTPARVRPVLIHIYYVAKCSVEVAGSCTGADNGSPIPTLKMVELINDEMRTVTIAEGIENMQIDYGLDTDSDGAPDVDVKGDATSIATPDDWKNVMSLKLHLVARSLEKSPDFTDVKTYDMGTSLAFGPGSTEPPYDPAYKRHAFVQSVRLVNPSGRRQP